MIAVMAFSLMTNMAYGQTTTPTTTPTPVVGYSLWFTNGTELLIDGANCYGVLYGGPYLNIGGIKPIASGFGSSADKTSSIVILRNDRNVSIDVTLTLQNVQVPSDIEISMHYFFMSNHTYALHSAVDGKQQGSPKPAGTWTVHLASNNGHACPTRCAPNWNTQLRFQLQLRHRSHSNTSIITNN